MSSSDVKSNARKFHKSRPSAAMRYRKKTPRPTIRLAAFAQYCRSIVMDSVIYRTIILRGCVAPTCKMPRRQSPRQQ
ncbi:uncharacterized protein N7487_005536 [Penicillium crustosum]|uniref:uncharacterized protein n=1 Tax=Penicillium crustosum TaxID=36656 RepID=UPI00239ABA08|nr:uncharacterized protein N7487_005536 [Penicillium crustosum]KAJ5411177.1 hypothetical protein N7487_005536 [Penicillium crustosum]